MKAITVMNRKGGVGKTTIALHLAACAAEMGLKTLLVDMDSQCNATTIVTKKVRKSSDLDIAVTDLWDEDSEMEFRKYGDFDFFILPGSEHAVAVPGQGTVNPEGMREARMAMDRLREFSFDLIVFDVPPAPGVLQLAPMLLGGVLVIPVIPDTLAVQGMVGAIRDRQMVLNSGVPLDMTILINKYKMTSANQSRMIEMLRKTVHKDSVLPEVFTDRVLAPDALREGKAVWQYAPRDPGASVWRRVCVRIVENLMNKEVEGGEDQEG